LKLSSRRLDSLEILRRVENDSDLIVTEGTVYLLLSRRGWLLTLGLGVGAGLLMEAFELFVSQPLLIRITGKQPDLSDFQAIYGNLKWTLILLALTCFSLLLAKRWCGEAIS
jgi:hypothetical protein